MAIGIPDTLTADNSEKYIVSIRLRPDGLSFSGYMPSGHGSFFYRDTEFSRQVPYIASLKDLFFSNECLSWNYKRIQIVNVSERYTIVPESYFDENVDDDLLKFLFMDFNGRSLNNELRQIPHRVVFGMDEDVYEFCARSFQHPLFFQHITPLVYLWKKQNKRAARNEMFVSFHRRLVDVVCFKNGDLLRANTFSVSQPGDALYYILYTWKQTQLDAENDVLHIGGDSTLREKVSPELRRYVRHILPLEIPSEAFILRGDVIKAPMDLISLSVCEL
jgi:hypothetical protein